MILQSISLQAFRNYHALDLDFHPQVTRIVGDNAQGKTNLLEAIYFLGRGHSFRSAQRVDMIQHGAELAILRARTSHHGLLDEYAAEIKRERNRYLRNGKAVRGPDQHWPYVILFAPEETLLFRNEPSARREYLDALISGLDERYKMVLRNFRRVLQQRNRILQQAGDIAIAQLKAQLAPWTEQLIAYGIQIVEARREWIEILNGTLPLMHGAFAAGDGELRLCYQPSVTDAATFRMTLAEREDEEWARQMTVVGPQRDELSATLAGMDLKHYGSQGQHRSVVISLKLAEVRLVCDRIGHAPILLLDDVASELDPGRLDAFFGSLHAHACQIILSTVHVADRLLKQHPESETITIVDGAILQPPEMAVSL